MKRMIENSNKARSSKVGWTIHTDLGPFGNRTDVIVVDGSTVRGVRHLDNCEQTELFNQYEWVDEGESL